MIINSSFMTQICATNQRSNGGLHFILFDRQIMIDQCQVAMCFEVSDGADQQTIY